MTNQEAIETIKANYPPENYSMLREALDIALALLKAQESHLVTVADFENADPYGYLPVWVEDKDDSEIICDCITKYAITHPDEDCHYRYWISRPTDEQRKAVKWE